MKKLWVLLKTVKDRQICIFKCESSEQCRNILKFLKHRKYSIVENGEGYLVKALNNGELLYEIKEINRLELKNFID